ncbi:MAG: metallophosphoesterase family protein [Desulfomonilaceae bacterium]
MKRLGITLTTLLTILVLSTATFAEDKFRFAVFSDTRGNLITKSCSDDNAGVSSILPLVRDHVLKINETKLIRLVLFPGDMVTGYFPRDAGSTSECNRVQLGKWREVMKPLLDKGIQVRVTVGNHEVGTFDPSKEDVSCGKHGRPYLPSYQNFQVFKDVLGDMLGEDNGPKSNLGLTYSFDVDGCHFAMISAYTMYENNSFSNETMQWLDNDLKTARDKGYKLFVASHPPAFPGGGHTWDSLPFFDPSYTCSDYSGIDRRKERDRFWNMLKKHGVIAYFCGHEHNTQIQLVDGCWQATIGGLTSELYKFNGAEGDTRRNLILYDGRFQNPKASVNWPWDENNEMSHWGWALVTVDDERVTMDIYGTEKLPESVDDFKKLKTFTLREAVRKY